MKGLPTGIGSLRATQSPRSRRSTSGKAEKEWPSASRAETRWRTDARGGTGLPETMSRSAISTGSPRSGAIVQVSAPQAVHVPSRSVKAGRPWGRSRARRPRRRRRARSASPRPACPRRADPSGGGGGVGHAGILGCGSPSAPPGPGLISTPRRIPVTYVISQPCVDVKDRACVDECPSTASTRASGCSTSTPTSASTAVRASRSARSRRSSTRTTRRRSGRTTTTPT